MIKKIIIKKYIIFLTTFIILTIKPFCLYGARDGGVERIRQCTGQDPSPFDKIHNIDANGFISVGKEMEFSLNNPVCLTQFGTIYVSVKTAIATINGACGTGSAIPRLFPSPIKDSADLMAASYKAATNPANRHCRSALLAGVNPILIAFSQMGIIYEVAKAEYKNVRVCGSDWYKADPNNYILSSTIEGSYGQYVDKYRDENLKNPSYNYENSKEYREWMHGGKEFNDVANEGDYCRDPSRNNQPQRYYMRGTRPGIFVCEKYNPDFLSEKRLEDKAKYMEAYKCCLKRSRNFICLEKSSYGGGEFWNNSNHIFCKANSKCSFNNNKAIIYETYRRDNDRLICARSYSLCPFNFSVGGGTIYPDYFKDAKSGMGFVPQKSDEDQSKNLKLCENKSDIRNSDCTFNKQAGKLKNYCQYYRHCTVVNPVPYNANFDMISPYFSKACINFIGDSQNGVTQGISYNPGLSLGHQSNFSAPIVQCLKETMENIFTNKAGHSKCIDGSYGDLKDRCYGSLGEDTYSTTADNFTYKKGGQVKKKSLFETLQIKLKTTITLVLVMSMMFFGVKILMLKVDFESRKDILMYIVKLAFVIYFVNGDAWKTIFFDGLYNGSNEIARIFFKINSIDSKNDKCNFGAMVNESGMKLFTNTQYPPGKNYLMIWDTLDCKIMQYLNYGPGFSSSTIFLLIVAAFFMGGVGLILAMSIFILAFSLIAVVIRAIHIFVSSAVAIIIYVFVSPIIIPLLLFEKTKSIFDAWLSHLMSFTLQPIILFSYLAIFITLSEKILYNNAIMENNELVCSKHCKDRNGKIETNLSNCRTSNYGEIIDPLDSSVSCLLNFKNYSSNSNGFLSSFGLAPVSSIENIFKTDGIDNTNRRIMLILKSALFLYILLQFADEISGITSNLIGENIDVKGMSGFEMLKKFTDGVRSIQKRGARFVKLRAQSDLGKARESASKPNESDSS